MRVEVDGLAPDCIENSFAEFESKAAHALKAVNAGAKFEGDHREIILNLVALLASRSPQRREQWRQFQAQIAERVMDLTLTTKERWESQIRQMKESGVKINDSVSYEDMKKFSSEKKYTIEVPTEHHIHMEMIAVEAILPYLSERKWVVIRAPHEFPFITTDHPVILLWKFPEEIPTLYRKHPGFGMIETQVYFPISSKVAIVGEFEGESADIDADQRLVAVINTIFLGLFHKQIYSSKLSFPLINEAGDLSDGRELLKAL